MNKLLILAYNEEKHIAKTIKQSLDIFDEIIVINDKSTDNTREIIEIISKKNSKVKLINNEKNYGPGKSLKIGIDYALDSSCKFVVKIDGDNQFEQSDVINILNIANKNGVDFIKGDRFWPGGIIGKIPKIRFLGNAIASLLIKFVTGNKNINDPLNGLFLFSSNLAKDIEIPKMFNRYGYPFYINALINKLSLRKKIEIKQYRNKISYGNEISNLNPLLIFIKLIFFSITFFVSFIKEKLKYSDYQLSALLDISSILSLLFSIFCLLRTFIIRLSIIQGNQGAWFILFIIFLILFFTLILSSRKSIENVADNNFSYIN